MLARVTSVGNRKKEIAGLRLVLEEQPSTQQFFTMVTAGSDVIRVRERVRGVGVCSVTSGMSGICVLGIITLIASCYT